MSRLTLMNLKSKDCLALDWLALFWSQCKWISLFLIEKPIIKKDVAVDGWVLTILTEDYISFGPATQTVGLMLGSLVSYNLFIPLNSTYFCNKYLFSIPRNVLLEILKLVETFRNQYWQWKPFGIWMLCLCLESPYLFISLWKRKNWNLKKALHSKKLLVW